MKQKSLSEQLYIQVHQNEWKWNLPPITNRFGGAEVLKVGSLRIHMNCWIISLTSLTTSQAFCPPITSAFISPSSHNCSYKGWQGSHFNIQWRKMQYAWEMTHGVLWSVKWTHLDCGHFLMDKANAKQKSQSVLYVMQGWIAEINLNG